MAIDSTVGTTTANSYVTVAEADAYFQDRLHSSDWTAATGKEAALITASRLLDWELTFQGSKTNQNQSMQFPRSGMIIDEYEISDVIIPQEIKFAVFELALQSLKKDRVVDNPMSGIEQVKAGPLFVKATPGGYDSTIASVIPKHIKSMLSKFLIHTGISSIRLIRG
jgi:hypothetical protein